MYYIRYGNALTFADLYESTYIKGAVGRPFMFKSDDYLISVEEIEFRLNYTYWHTSSVF